MTLHEAIKDVLLKYKRPLPASFIASAINVQNLYTRNDNIPLQSAQILTRVKNYPLLFQNINGHIVLVENDTWKNLLTSYRYLVDILRGIYNVTDVQFIIAVLFYYKRLADINRGNGGQDSLSFDKHLSTPLDYLLDKGNSFIKGLELLENDRIGPEGIFEECARLLVKLDQNKLQEVWITIRNLDTRYLEDKAFGTMYEYFLMLDAVENYKSSVTHTPYSLRELMTDLLDAETGHVYDPVAGTGGLLIETLLHANTSKLRVTGTEINNRVAQLGNMSLQMYGLKQAHIEPGDCFKQINSSKQYDYIIGDFPAYGITNSTEYRHLYNKYGLEAPKSGRSFGSLVLLTLSKLTKTGKAVLTVSDGFLTKKGKEKEIRDLLIENDVIESIISLPFGTLRPYTDAKASVLVINLEKPRHLQNCIQFITAEIIDQNPKSVALNNEEIIQAYRDKKSVQKNAVIINYTELRPETNLSVEAYDVQFMIANQLLKEGAGKLLNDLVEIKAGTNPDKADVSSEGEIPLIKIENLSKEILDLHLDTQVDHYVTYEGKYARAVVEQDSILVARIGDSIKPTIFRRNSETPRIIPHSNVYALIPKAGTNISLEYLYYQLQSSFVKEQIEKRKLGAVMPYVSMSGLRDIVIPYANLESQHQYTESQKANLIAEERKRVEDKIQALGYKEEVKQAESTIISTLTHQLRPTFLGLSNLVNRIERIIEREQLTKLTERNETKLKKQIDPEIAEHITIPDNFTLQQLLQKLSNDSNHLSDILSNVDRVMNFKLTQDDLKSVNVLEFFKNYKAQKEIEVGKSYTITIKGDESYAYINEAAFKELLDQLLLNAEKHAFSVESKKRSNKIQFVIAYNRQRNVISIVYSNNGAPYELREKDFTTAFEKGNRSEGSGIGGNYISRIVEAHNGKLNVTENYTEGFKLTIELPAIKDHTDE